MCLHILSFSPWDISRHLQTKRPGDIVLQHFSFNTFFKSWDGNVKVEKGNGEKTEEKEKEDDDKLVRVKCSSRQK